MTASRPPSDEAALFLDGSQDRRLFAILHRAAGASTGKAIVYCAPILEEKLNCHRIGVHFARRAAVEGFHVLRFDYGGDGESEGEFADASVPARVEDISAAARWIREATGAREVFLVGVRFGAALALLAAERDTRVSGVVGWAPVLQGGPYLYEALRANLTSQLATYKKVVRDRAALVADIRAGGTVDVEGWEIGRILYESAEEVDFLARPLLRPIPVLAIRIGKKPLREPPYRSFLTANPGGTVRVESADELEFWNPQSIAYPACDGVFSMTLEWLRAPGGTESRS